MRNDPNHLEPNPAQLAAFLDGELDPAGRARVEAWLSAHPDAAGEIEGQRRLLRVWAENAPSEPTAAAWAATRDRIEARLSRPVAGRWPLPRSLWLGVGAAAALTVAALLTRFFLPGAPPKIQNTEPAPVIQRDAVPPADPPILLASQDDVSVMSLEPYANDDGKVPQIGEGEVPMIVAPSLARAGTP